MYNEPLISEILSSFIKLMSKAEDKYELMRTLMFKEEELTQDILHKIELGGYDNRNKLATQLKHNRQDRRYYKDITEEYAPLVDWLSKNKGAINSLKQTLGEIRRVEKYHKNRTYTPKVMKAGDKK